MRLTQLQQRNAQKKEVNIENGAVKCDQQTGVQVSVAKTLVKERFDHAANDCIFEGTALEACQKEYWIAQNHYRFW